MDRDVVIVGAGVVGPAIAEQLGGLDGIFERSRSNGYEVDPGVSPVVCRLQGSG